MTPILSPSVEDLKLKEKVENQEREIELLREWRLRELNGRREAEQDVDRLKEKMVRLEVGRRTPTASNLKARLDKVAVATADQGKRLVSPATQAVEANDREAFMLETRHTLGGEVGWFPSLFDSDSRARIRRGAEVDQNESTSVAASHRLPTAAVRDWPTPRTLTELRLFLSLANYYRKFVRNFSTIAAPLRRLLKKEAIWQWDKDCMSALKKLKRALIEYPVLKVPDPSLPFVVTTDASQYGMGVVLQQDNENGYRPIESMPSRMPSEKVATSTYERELYALRQALEHSKHYLLGRNFKVYSDHETLPWLKTQAVEIDRYDFELKPVKGKYNVVADALNVLSIVLLLRTTHPLFVSSSDILPSPLEFVEDEIGPLKEGMGFLVCVLAVSSFGVPPTSLVLAIGSQCVIGTLWREKASYGLLRKTKTSSWGRPVKGGYPLTGRLGECYPLRVLWWMGGGGGGGDVVVTIWMARVRLSMVVTRAEMAEMDVLMLSMDDWRDVIMWKRPVRTMATSGAGVCSPARLWAVLSTKSEWMPDISMLDDWAMVGEEAVVGVIWVWVEVIVDEVMRGFDWEGMVDDCVTAGVVVLVTKVGVVVDEGGGVDAVLAERAVDVGIWVIGVDVEAEDGGSEVAPKEVMKYEAKLFRMAYIMDRKSESSEMFLGHLSFYREFYLEVKAAKGREELHEKELLSKMEMQKEKLAEKERELSQLKKDGEKKARETWVELEVTRKARDALQGRVKELKNELATVSENMRVAEETARKNREDLKRFAMQAVRETDHREKEATEREVSLRRLMQVEIAEQEKHWKAKFNEKVRALQSRLGKFQKENKFLHDQIKALQRRLGTSQREVKLLNEQVSSEEGGAGNGPDGDCADSLDILEGEDSNGAQALQNVPSVQLHNAADRKWKRVSALKATMDELLQRAEHGLTPTQILNNFARALPDPLHTQLYPRTKEEGMTYEKFSKIALDHAGFLAEANYCHYWKDLQAGKKWQNRTISGSIPGKDNILLTFEEGGVETLSYDQIDYGLEGDAHSGPVVQEGDYTAVVARRGGRQGRGRTRGRGGRGRGGKGPGTRGVVAKVAAMWEEGAMVPRKVAKVSTPLGEEALGIITGISHNRPIQVISSSGGDGGDGKGDGPSLKKKERMEKRELIKQAKMLALLEEQEAKQKHMEEELARWKEQEEKLAAVEAEAEEEVEEEGEVEEEEPLERRVEVLELTLEMQKLDSEKAQLQAQ
ncbi:hypothetical protein CBR_g23542, partial [Chara braunii]